MSSESKGGDEVEMRGVAAPAAAANRDLRADLRVLAISDAYHDFKKENKAEAARAVIPGPPVAPKDGIKDEDEVLSTLCGIGIRREYKGLWNRGDAAESQDDDADSDDDDEEQGKGAILNNITYSYTLGTNWYMERYIMEGGSVGITLQTDRGPWTIVEQHAVWNSVPGKDVYFVVDTYRKSIKEMCAKVNTGANPKNFYWVQNRQTLYDPAKKTTPLTDSGKKFMFAPGSPITFAYEDSIQDSRATSYPAWQGLPQGAAAQQSQYWNNDTVAPENAREKNMMFFTEQNLVNILLVKDVQKVSAKYAAHESIIILNRKNNGGKVVMDNKIAKKKFNFNSDKGRLVYENLTDVYESLARKFFDEQMSLTKQFLDNDHVIAKRLGDQGQALSCLRPFNINMVGSTITVPTTNQLCFVTFDRPALAAAIIYGVPLILFWKNNWQYELFINKSIMDPNAAVRAEITQKYQALFSEHKQLMTQFTMLNTSPDKVTAAHVDAIKSRVYDRLHLAYQTKIAKSETYREFLRVNVHYYRLITLLVAFNPADIQYQPLQQYTAPVQRQEGVDYHPVNIDLTAVAPPIDGAIPDGDLLAAIELFRKHIGLLKQNNERLQSERDAWGQIQQEENFRGKPFSDKGIIAHDRTEIELIKSTDIFNEGKTVPASRSREGADAPLIGFIERHTMKVFLTKWATPLSNFNGTLYDEYKAAIGRLIANLRAGSVYAITFAEKIQEQLDIDDSLVPADSLIVTATTDVSVTAAQELAESAEGHAEEGPAEEGAADEDAAARGALGQAAFAARSANNARSEASLSLGSSSDSGSSGSIQNSRQAKRMRPRSLPPDSNSSSSTGDTASMASREPLGVRAAALGLAGQIAENAKHTVKGDAIRGRSMLANIERFGLTHMITSMFENIAGCLGSARMRIERRFEPLFGAGAAAAPAQAVGSKRKRGRRQEGGGVSPDDITLGEILFHDQRIRVLAWLYKTMDELDVLPFETRKKRVGKIDTTTKANYELPWQVWAYVNGVGNINGLDSYKGVSVGAIANHLFPKKQVAITSSSSSSSSSAAAPLDTKVPAPIFIDFLAAGIDDIDEDDYYANLYDSIFRRYERNKIEYITSDKLGEKPTINPKSLAWRKLRKFDEDLYESIEYLQDAIVLNDFDTYKVLNEAINTIFSKNNIDYFFKEHALVRPVTYASARGEGAAVAAAAAADNMPPLVKAETHLTRRQRADIDRQLSAAGLVADEPSYKSDVSRVTASLDDAARQIISELSDVAKGSSGSAAPLRPPNATLTAPSGLAFGNLSQPLSVALATMQEEGVEEGNEENNNAGRPPGSPKQEPIDPIVKEVAKTVVAFIMSTPPKKGGQVEVSEKNIQDQVLASMRVPGGSPEQIPVTIELVKRAVQLRQVKITSESEAAGPLVSAAVGPARRSYRRSRRNNNRRRTYRRAR